MLPTLPILHQQLVSKRLLLREPRMTDARDIYDFCSKSSASKYADWFPHQSIAESKAYIAWLKKEVRKSKGHTYTWFVEERNEKKVIATLSLVDLDNVGQIGTVGYTLSEDFWHKGYATEFLFTLVKYLFLELDLKRVQAKVMVENKASINLLQRVGFVNEGLLRRGVFCKGECVDIYIFGLTIEDFVVNYKSYNSYNFSL